MQDKPTQGRGQTATDEATNRIGGAVDEASETTDSTMQQARDKAMDTADQAKDKTAEGMASAAETIRDKVGSTGGVAGTAGTRLADGMEKTAEYLREHDTQELMSDLDQYIKDHPTQAIIGAVAIGFIIGRMLR
jgi:ElaB/YqjD/DUF883 family membrane-anchored ribosome-binding protein